MIILKIYCLTKNFKGTSVEEILNLVYDQLYKPKSIFYDIFLKSDFFKSFEKPKASVITTFYNSKKYINNFMESLTRQTYFNNTLKFYYLLNL